MPKKRKGEGNIPSHINECNEEILSFALNCSSDGFVLLNEEATVLFINKKFEEWTRISNAEWKHKIFPIDSLFLENFEKEIFKNLLNTCKEGKDGELTFGLNFAVHTEQRLVTVSVKQHEHKICCMFKQVERLSFNDKQKLEFYELADNYLPEFAVARYEPDKHDVLSMFSSKRTAKKKQEIGCTQLYNRYYIADLKFSNARQWVDAVSKVGPDNPVTTFESLVTFPGGPDTYLFLVLHFVREDEYGRKIIVSISDPAARNQAHLTKHSVEMVSEIASSVQHMFEDPELIPGTMEVVDEGTDIVLKIQSSRRFLEMDPSKPKPLSQLGWTRQDIELWLVKCSECNSRKAVMFEFRPQHATAEVFQCQLLHFTANSYVVIILSLSVRKELESKLNQHKQDLESQVYRYTKELDEALQIKSRFLAVMSHEMRTPLSGVLATLSLLNDTKLDTDQKELVRIGEVCGQQLLLVINDILDYGKLDANKVVLESIPFHLKNALEESVEVVSFEAHTKSIDLMSCIDISVPDFITGDPGRLRQILVNLLSNAVKFSLQGEVVLSTRAVSNGLSDSIEISVKDEGIGIEESQRPKIFQAFSQVDTSVTRRHAGTGLGLSISKRLAELMGGKMWFHSKVGVGSTFYVQIPFKKHLEMPQPNSMQVELNPNTPISILIVEKSSTLLHHLYNILEQRGFRSHCTTSMAEAQLYALDSALKLILVDARFDLVDIKSLSKGHVVYLLGNSPDNKTQGPNSNLDGVLPFIRKPVTEGSLMKVVLKEHNMPVEENHKSTDQTAVNLSISDIVQTYKILLAEDNQLNQQIVIKMLQKIGFNGDNIFLAENGKQAVDFVRNFMQDGQNLDVILMDIMMPEMGGLEATEIIRREYGPLPVIIALTANAFTEDRVKCLQCGMNSVLIKPVHKQDLINTLLKFASMRKDKNNQ